MTEYFLKRVKNLRKLIDQNQVVLLTKSTDITYFTNFPQIVPEEREAFFLCTSKKSWIFHHSFSPPPVAFKSLTAVPKAHLPEIVSVLQKLSESKKIEELLIDDSNLTYKEFAHLENNIDLTIKKFDREKIWKLRKIKDPLEIKLLFKAGKIVKKTLKKVIKNLAVGITELELAAQLNFEMKKMGAEMPAFPTIVAFGENGALPHHQPTTKKLKNNTPVLIDVGARHQGYRSDITRSFWFGKNPNDEFLKVEKIVKKAYRLGIAKLENASKNTDQEFPLAKQLDETVREYISQQGYGKEFVHTTGHGLGLDIHEPPSISWKNESRLLAGMIITVEPGIYLKGKFGYRHENTVYLKEKGIKILTE